jgi:hypothetical protein
LIHFRDVQRIKQNWKINSHTKKILMRYRTKQGKKGEENEDWKIKV